jgi:hypothetical protein
MNEHPVRGILCQRLDPESCMNVRHIVHTEAISYLVVYYCEFWGFVLLSTNVDVFVMGS